MNPKNPFCSDLPLTIGLTGVKANALSSGHEFSDSAAGFCHLEFVQGQHCTAAKCCITLPQYKPQIK